MFSGRQVRIIKKILANAQGVHGSELANTLNVSSRTIRNEITEINSIYGESVIVGNKKTGYCIDGKFSVPIKNLLHNSNLYINDSKNFIYELFGKILFNEGIILDELSDLLNYSTQTIKKEIYKLEEFLDNTYQSNFISVVSETIVINAEEEEIRSVLFKIIKDVITTNSDETVKVLELILNDGYDENIYSLIFEQLSELCDKYEMQISIENMKILQAAILITITRNEYGFTSKNSEITNKSFLVDLLGRLPELKNSDLSILNDIVHTFKIIKKNSDIEIQDFSRVVLDEFIDEVFEKYNLNLKESSELYQNMLVHIEFMLRRVERGYELRNPIISDIKKKYPFAYEVSMLIVHIVFKYRMKYILDDEVSYLAIYIEHFLENINEKIRALLISSQRHSVNQVLEKWINLNFQNQVIIHKVIDHTQYKKYNLDSFDLIISFDDAIYPTITETFVFNGLPEVKDIHRMNDSLHRIKMNQRVKMVINKTIDKQFIRFFDSSDFETVIRSLSEVFEMYNVIDSKDEFSKDVISREVNYPTNLDDAIMLPHPLNTFANKTSIAVGVVRKGFQHNNETIKLVFLIALEKVRSSEVNFLFQFFKQLSNDKHLLKGLVECSNEDDFIEKLSTFYLNQ